MARAIIIVADSFGIGSAPDAAKFGDQGSDTLGHIAEQCAKGLADSDKRSGPLNVPNMVALGAQCVGAGWLLSSNQTIFECSQEIGTMDLSTNRHNLSEMYSVFLLSMGGRGDGRG